MPDLAEFTSRYGASLPDPATLCPGDCEGLRFVPVQAPPDIAGPWRKPDALLPINPDSKYDEAWRESSATPDELGYKFLVCKDCGGSGRP